LFFEMSDQIGVEVYRPVVLNDVNGLSFGIGLGHLPIELDQLIGRDRLGLSEMHPSIHCVETSCNAMFFFRSMGKMRSGLKGFSFRLVVFCQGRLAIVPTLVLIEKDLALRLSANLIEGLLDIVALFLVV